MHDRILGGRYWLLEPHAMGGMASVWRAIDGRTTETVAIKRLHPHLVADESARTRLEREAATLASIRHPNVVGVRELILDADDPALVLDFVAGRSLAERLADPDAPVARGEALAIAAAVADGLGSVHAAGIVHRDVKPANVLLADDGTVRLSDFGIAVGLDDATALTAADGVVGTLRYLAPERLAGAPATPATDVWGVGAILYELLAGHPAFPAGTVAERVEATVEDLERPTGLDDATWSAVTSALATDPADRYANGAALSAAIRALPGFPAEERIASAVLDAPTEVIPIASAAAGTAALAGASAGASRSPAGVRAVAAPADPAVAADPVPPPTRAPIRADASSGRRPWALGALLAALIAVAAVGMAAGGDAGAIPAGDPGASTPAEPSAAEATAAPEKAEPAEAPGKSSDRGKGKAKGHDKDEDEGEGGD